MDKIRWLELNDWPIRYKLIMHFLLIWMLPSIGLGFLINWTVDSIIERQVTDNTLQLIGKVNRSLEYYVGNLQNITYFMSNNPSIRQFLDGTGDEKLAEGRNHYETRQFLQGFSTLYSEVAGILIASDSGEYISNELYAKDGYRMTDESWYKEAVDNQGIFKIVGHPFGRHMFSHVNYRDSEVVSVVRAIVDPDTQRVLGVALIDLKLRVIAEAAKDVRLGKSGYLMVIDDKGESIYSPAKPLVHEISTDWLADGPSGTLSKVVDGNRLQFIYLKSAFTNWTTIGVFLKRESVFEAREIQFYIVSFVFLVCLFGIAASYLLSHSISRPIGQLTNFMQKAESGDLLIRYIGERRDEVGMLGRSFNRMLTEISKLIHLTERQERQKREAELRTLTAHIRPHFLYNTLDTIHWMARRRDAEDVAEVVESLSKLFRIGLSKGSDRIPLAEELAHVESYMKIQRIRYRDKLAFTEEIQQDALHYYVPKLVLQPLVENAIYHGIKERRGPGVITLVVSEEDGLLMMRVSDNGAGIKWDKLESIRSGLAKAGGAGMTAPEEDASAQVQGYGLVNVHERIRLTYGDEYGLTIDSEFGAGTTVTIVLPAES
ncbi:sensor histidine kinase [Paenibacillus sp. GCM10012307]|uniref:histidine kinase n=1 Tax=Paenibacillus roseus TaxID=2798579 RepID=A0A934J4A9_9BACL|nr:sensor histidine kinase [Paenibacillus roseus]MBJ6363029.1 sensor histidine kinase [Paenibacillus roseus]